ncbi:uncharacterized protein METZ01_LOCUS164402 [marine metagenome]|uniref:LPS export ABC transporter periplasmic protein LptC n=1 Tax=marine metagenome TaxID=408172 RepID=A0A382BCP7_9ZZZZ
MKRTIRMIVWLIMVSLFSVCGNRGESDDSDFTEELIENEIWNPLIILSREESRIVAAKAEKLYQSSNDLALLVGNVEVDFFSEEGDHISILYSDSAQINEQSNNLNANGNVFVVSDSGYTLTTSKILWDNRYKMIIAEDSVMFTTTEGDTMYGVGFESDMDLDQWRIFRIYGVTREGI